MENDPQACIHVYHERNVKMKRVGLASLRDRDQGTADFIWFRKYQVRRKKLWNSEPSLLIFGGKLENEYSSGGEMHCDDSEKLDTEMDRSDKVNFEGGSVDDVDGIDIDSGDMPEAVWDHEDEIYWYLGNL